MYPVAVAADGVAKLWDCGSAKCISDLANLGTAINCCTLGVFPEQVHQQNITGKYYNLHAACTCTLFTCMQCTSCSSRAGLSCIIAL